MGWGGVGGGRDWMATLKVKNMLSLLANSFTLRIDPSFEKFQILGRQSLKGKNLLDFKYGISCSLAWHSALRK